jgi:hypothetical protein
VGRAAGTGDDAAEPARARGFGVGEGIVGQAMCGEYLGFVRDPKRRKLRRGA